MVDWQTALVVLSIAGAALYVGHRAWVRLRAFQASRNAETSCATGCGTCDDGGPRPKIQPTVLVEIGGIKAKGKR